MSSKSQSTGSTDNNQPTPTAHKSGMTRRDLLRRSAVGAATVGAVSTGSVRLDHGPVQNSQAIAPAVIAAGVGGSLATAWTMRNIDNLLAGDVPDGLSPSALHGQIYDTANARQSNNRSTFIDNKNILDGIDHVAFGDGKISAIESLNEQNSESDVLADGQDKANEYLTTVMTNFFKGWNESVQEYQNLFKAVDNHDDLDSIDVFHPSDHGGCQYDDGDRPVTDVILEPVDYEMPDGSTFELKELQIIFGGNGEIYITPVEHGFDDTDPWVTCTDLHGPGGRSTQDSQAVISQPGWQDADDPDWVSYLDFDEWNEIYQKLADAVEQVNDELGVWVSNIYSDVQDGELDTADLLTPREMAELTSDDEEFPQAIADLQALNISTDLEREAEIYFSGPEATAYGQLSYTGDTTLSTGQINPDELDEDDEPVYSGSFYFTYDVSQGQGTWSAHDGGIDGGTLTFTSEPFAESLYVITTGSDETAEVVTDDFEHDDEADEWTVDLSDQLDDRITSVESVEYYSDVSSTQYETIGLTETFEIVSFTDSDGNEYDESNFESSEPHADDNYITEEEWKEQQERHEELIQQYEDAQGSGISIPGVEDVLSGEANGLIGIAVVGMVLVSAILSALNPLS